MYEFNCILKTDLKNLYTNPMWWAGTIGLPLLLALDLAVPVLRVTVMFQTYNFFLYS